MQELLLEEPRPLAATSLRALIVDLNNFARYPTLSIGYLVAALRTSGIAVEVLCPLAYGVEAVERERPERLWDHIQRRVYLSTHPGFAKCRDVLHSWRSRRTARPRAHVLQEVRAALQRRPQVVLLSAYLDHYAYCVAIGAVAHELGVPVMIGGPMFSNPEIARAWLDVPGIVLVAGTEVENTLPGLVRDVVAGADLLVHPGVVLPDGRRSPTAERAEDLDDLPRPDFDDFPWNLYRERVIPIMASRGCQWAKCAFCSDILTANGKSYRSRNSASILSEMREQAERYASKNFIFLDIKLNSDVALWRRLIEKTQDAVPGARWIGTVHVDLRRDNGLSAEDLAAAAQNGMARISFGLESGSQRVLDAMDKGCAVERNCLFLEQAHAAGLSVRATMMQGFPGEKAQDLELTTHFLERHRERIDRIRMSRFKLIPGVKIHNRMLASHSSYPELRSARWDMRAGRAALGLGSSKNLAYRRFESRLLRIVHEINKRPLRSGAEIFDGLM